VAEKLNKIIDNLEYILGIELLTACQAIEFRRPLKSSEMLEFAHEFVRKHVSFAKEDRIFADDIEKTRKLISNFSFVHECDEFASEKRILLNEGYEEFNY
jgi:histidine ammonia-lyase